jgi:DNA-binding CsgD family transcriptional regulator
VRRVKHPTEAPRDLVALESEDEDVIVLRFALKPDRPSAPLTPVESAIVGQILEGRSNAQIAAARGCAPRTVANHVANIFRKLAVCSRLELVARTPLYHGGEADGGQD